MHCCPLGGRDLVADTLGRDLTFELGKGEQHVQRQAPHRVGGVELLGDGDEGDPAGIERLDDPGEVSMKVRQWRLKITLADDPVAPQAVCVPLAERLGHGDEVARHAGDFAECANPISSICSKAWTVNTMCVNLGKPWPDQTICVGRGH